MDDLGRRARPFVRLLDFAVRKRRRLLFFLEMLLAISQFLAVTITILLVGSLFVLRRKEPDAPRPYRAWGYPFAPLLMLAIGVVLFFGYIYSNPYPSLYSIGLLLLSYPLFRLVARRMRRQ